MSKIKDFTGMIRGKMTVEEALATTSKNKHGRKKKNQY